MAYKFGNIVAIKNVPAFCNCSYSDNVLLMLLTVTGLLIPLSVSEVQSRRSWELGMS